MEKALLERWQQHENEYDIFKEDKKDNRYKEWQDLLFQKFLAFQEEEKTRRGIEDTDLPEHICRTQLRRIIQNIHEITGNMHTDLIEDLLDNMYRMGPLQPLWSRPLVSDIQCFIPFDPRYPQVFLYTERGERHIYDGPGFKDFDAARDWVNKHIARIGLKFDPGKITINGTLPGSDRVHVIAGVSAYSMAINQQYTLVRCMVISVRRFVNSFTLGDLTDKSTMLDESPILDVTKKKVKYTRKTRYAKHTGGMADQASMDFLRIMGAMRKNFLIAGGTGLGKTTTANALTAVFPESQILLILEEAPEMQPQNKGICIRIFEREGKFTIEQGLTEALRMFPDRIFVAEIRGSVGFTFLEAIRSGHDGSGSTIHASSCKAAIKRLIDYAAKHESAPSRKDLREYVYEHIDTIIHGLRNGNMRFFDEIIQLLPNGTEHKVMEFVQKGVDANKKPVGYFVFYGPTDEFVQEMLRNGYDIPKSWGWEIEEEGEEAA